MPNSAPLNCSIDFINNILISSNKWTVNEFFYIPGCKWLHCASLCVESSQSCQCLASPQITGKMNVLLIESVLKGYRECPLKYSDGWIFSSWEKIGIFGEPSKMQIFCYSLVCTWKSGGGGQISCFLQELVLLKRCCPVNLCLFM